MYYLRHAILHKTAAEDTEGGAQAPPAVAKSKLDPRVQAWLDDKKKAGEKQYMDPDSIIGMIQADKAMKDTSSKLQRLQNMQARGLGDPATVKAEIDKLQAELGKNRGIVDTFNKRRELRKQYGVTPEFYKREYGHEQKAIKSASDAFMKTLRDAGFKGEGLENIPEEVRAKAEKAATEAGEGYVKGRLGFLSDKEAADIQRYSQWQKARQGAGIEQTPFQYNDPKFQQQLGQMALSYGVSEDPLGAVKKGLSNLGSDVSATDSAYNQFMNKMRGTYMGATQNMQQRYSDERTAKIKKWAPWVIGGGALLTGLLAGFSGGDKKEEKPVDAWTAAQMNPDKMAWTKNSFRDASRNPNQTVPTGSAPKSPFGGAFRDFMSQNPFGRA